jgi:5-methylthioadenosine/S-adenosylhomocysteine deaminase
VSLAASASHAVEPFPVRPAQFVVPFAAGGGLDLNARNFAQAMSDVLKQPVTVTNRDGASGTIGLQSVAVAKSDGYPRDKAIDFDDLRRVQQQWFTRRHDSLLTLGYAARGTRYPGAYPAEWKVARKMGLPISVHANITKRFGNETEIETFFKDGLLGSDVQVIHAITAPPSAIEAMAKTGTSVSLSPYTEMRIGFGFPKTGEFVAAGVLTTLSVDTAALSGNADMFGVMKATLNVENAKAESEFKLTARRVLKMTTIDGARGMGVADKVGSLVVGKRADIIMVRTSDLNIGPMTDAAHLLVEAAQPSNVDTVLVDVRILKRRGKLTAIHADQLVQESAEALTGIKQRAGWV